MPSRPRTLGILRVRRHDSQSSEPLLLVRFVSLSSFSPNPPYAPYLPLVPLHFVIRFQRT